MTLPPFDPDDQPPAWPSALVRAADLTFGFHRILNFRLATTVAGVTAFHRLVAWERAAEVLAQYALKGRELLLEGRLSPRVREVEGQRVDQVELVVETFHLLGARGVVSGEEEAQ